MQGFPWFPIGYRLPDETAIGRLQAEGPGYQLVSTTILGRVVLLLEADSLAGQSAASFFDLTKEGFQKFEYGGRDYFARAFSESNRPFVINDWSRALGLPASSDALAAARAIERTIAARPRADIERSLFLPELDACLPVADLNAAQDLRPLAVRILTGSGHDPSLNSEQIHAVNSWLTTEEIDSFFSALGVRTHPQSTRTEAVDPTTFSLPGRPELEQFFREYVLEPNAERDRYTALGVKLPNGVLLYGPPGSGKSHAVGKLKAALNWPVYELDLGAIGSPFIHQTSVAIRKAFDEAKQKAPALIVLEEVDALAASRGPMTHDHKIEEVAQLLRLVETASENRILVIATTNRRDALDAAIMRKGRFDHAIEVGYPGPAEVRAALDAMLRERPHREMPNLEQLSQRLAGRPMSDIAWVINEAARQAARARKDAIDEIDCFSALNRLAAVPPSNQDPQSGRLA